MPKTTILRILNMTVVMEDVVGVEDGAVVAVYMGEIRHGLVGGLLLFCRPCGHLGQYIVRMVWCLW